MIAVALDPPHEVAAVDAKGMEVLVAKARLFERDTEARVQRVLAIGEFLACDRGQGIGSNADFGFSSFTARGIGGTNGGKTKTE